MGFILIFYLIAVFIFIVIGLVGIFHAVKYKMPGDKILIGTYVFIGLSAVIIIGSLILMFRGDWSAKPKILQFGESQKVGGLKK